MPTDREQPRGPKATAFGQLCVLFFGVGLVASLVLKTLWPLIIFAAAVYLVLLFTNRFERKETEEAAAGTGRRPGPK